MTDQIKKATRHTNQNEGLIFERSSPGKRAFELPPLDVPALDSAKSLGAHHRANGVEGFPEVSEIEVIRPFNVELRHRSRHVPARFLHHEVQPSRE
jgi:hypothetical protein